MRIEYIPVDKEDTLSFIIEGIDVAFANTLRRTVMMETPIYACNDIVFYKNSSPLYDEMVSHRLGLVPMTTPVDTEEGAKMVTMSLEAEGPRTIYSGDLVSDDPEVKPINDGFPILKLGQDQSISLNAECTVGFGRNHVKWQAGLASYKNYPVIEVDPERCNLCGECVNACPVKILEMKERVVANDVIKCTFCRSCEDACKKLNENKIISVEPMEDKFIFKIETFGNMNTKDLLNTALNVIENKAKELDQLLNE
ncbi:MAG TPA: DNA-directed RNA polymerase subunit D [Candidatus Methanofastidiosa archaeon]|nr:DNA-directed RNA polymerase subunit D [Candidatus Methanofastidiosa archaeon]HPR42617.1 DNA-directed RNA polymerase subunit D [Candidatus Methanofastidiosa archaeon]